tara:strand:+ start:242 stop:517 length:276 start_codon:yes stop_codon:yes gene_type:complete
MTKQYIENHSISRHEAEDRLRAIFETEEILVINQGQKINFTIPHTKQLFGQQAFVLDWQIEALREFNYRLTQVCSSSKGLTIWVTEVQDYE